MSENLRPPWKPGQSGNPAGYSRGRRLTDAVLKLIDDEGAEEEIARKWLDAIRSGDFRYFKEFIDRVEGKTVDRHEVAGLDGAPFVSTPTPEALTGGAALLVALGIARKLPENSGSGPDLG
jgi:hypothetical protein